MIRVVGNDTYAISTKMNLLKKNVSSSSQKISAIYNKNSNYLEVHVKTMWNISLPTFPGLSRYRKL